MLVDPSGAGSEEGVGLVVGSDLLLRNAMGYSGVVGVGHDSFMV